MGNNNVVECKSPQPPLSPPGGFQPPPPTALGFPDKPAPGSPPATAPAPPAPPPESSKLTNPGVFAELHKKSKEVYPTPFDGLRVALVKGLNNHLQVNHSLNLSSAPNGMNYHFGTTYVGSPMNPTDPYPLLIGDVDNAGSLMAQMMHQLTSRIKSKCVIQTQVKEIAMMEMGLDYKGDDCTGTMTLGNVDVLAGSGLVVAHYLQRITTSLDLGAELMYQYSPGMEKAMLQFGGRYSGGDWEMAFQASPMSWSASYFHKGVDLFEKGIEHKFGVNYDYSSIQQESTVQLGWEIDIPKAGSTVRGMIDTNWTVASVFETKLEPLPFTLCLSGMLNHTKNLCRFGIALQLGG